LYVYVAFKIIPYAPFASIAIAKLLNMNPFDIIIDFILPSPYSSPYISFLTKFISFCSYLLILVIMFEALKILPILIFFMVVSNQFWLSNISLLEELFEQDSLFPTKSPQLREQVYLNYTKLQVINTEAKRFAAPAALVMIHTTVTIISGLLYLVVRTHSLLPLEIYFVLLFGTILFLIGFVVVMTTTAKLFETSNAAITSWNVQLFDCKNKRLKRQFKSLRPFAFFVGINGIIFYPLDQSSYMEFLQAIQDKTIDWLVSIPLATLSRMLRFG